MTRRLVIGVCRGGTTALLQGLTQHPSVEGLYQPIKSGLRSSGSPDYGFFRTPDIETSTLVAKETFGWANAAECAFPLFPNDQAIEETRPVFLFREPHATYRSWASLGWGDLDLFVLAYSALHAALQEARTVGGRTLVVRHDELGSTPERAMRRICAHWDLRFDRRMVQWPTGLLDNPRILRLKGRGSPLGFDAPHHATLAKSREFGEPRERPPLSSWCERRIEVELAGIYLALQRDPTRPVRRRA